MSTPVTEQRLSRKPPAFMNKVVKFLAGSPLHGLVSKHIMLITFKGRKSGKLITTPIGYIEEGDVVKCYTDHQWWKNLVANPEVTLRIRGKKVKGRAEVVHDDVDAVSRELADYIGHTEMAARAFQVELDEHKKPVEASLRKAAQVVAVIRVPINR